MHTLKTWFRTSCTNYNHLKHLLSTVNQLNTTKTDSTALKIIQKHVQKYQMCSKNQIDLIVTEAIRTYKNRQL